MSDDGNSLLPVVVVVVEVGSGVGLFFYLFQTLARRSATRANAKAVYSA